MERERRRTVAHVNPKDLRLDETGPLGALSVFVQAQFVEPIQVECPNTSNLALLFMMKADDVALIISGIDVSFRVYDGHAVTNLEILKSRFV